MDLDREDIVSKILLNEGYPGWLYCVNLGATTIWERWNSYTVEAGFGGNNSMNSFNHYAYGAIVEWMYRYMAGIEVIEPGFKKFALCPRIDLRSKKDFKVSIGSLRADFITENNKIVGIFSNLPEQYSVPIPF